MPSSRGACDHQPNRQPAAAARIACPTLILCGRQDALIPLALHEEMAARISGFQARNRGGVRASLHAGAPGGNDTALAALARTLRSSGRSNQGA